MRPLPDEISPLPRAALASLDAGAIRREDAGGLPVTAHHDKTERCAIHVRRNAPDHALVSGSIRRALRDSTNITLSDDLDAAGQPRGIRIDEFEEGACLAMLGFEVGDVLLEINGYSLGPYLSRREAFESIDDADPEFAVIHFVRAQKTIEWRFDQSK